MAKTTFSQTTNADISATIIALEKAALDKWNQGDPGGYLDISADDVSYFDPFTEQRLDGLEALKKYYEPIKGQVAAKYEMLNIPENFLLACEVTRQYVEENLGATRMIIDYVVTTSKLRPA